DAQGGVTIYGDGGADTTNIESIGAQSAIHGGEGDDIINVGNPAHLIGNIDGTLSIYGDPGFDRINVDNSGSITDTAGTLSGNLLTGLDMGGQIEYASAEDLRIDLGTGSDNFTVAGTHAGLTRIADQLGDN